MKFHVKLQKLITTTVEEAEFEIEHKDMTEAADWVRNALKQPLVVEWTRREIPGAGSIVPNITVIR